MSFLKILLKHAVVGAAAIAFVVTISLIAIVLFNNFGLLAGTGFLLLVAIFFCAINEWIMKEPSDV